MFFVFEGADGVGKTTQAQMLADRLRQERGCRIEMYREPGGTALGEQVRKLLLDPASGELSPQTEMFLFMAARSHLLNLKILPALSSGTVVICDRYLWSSVVYQGIVGGLSAQQVLRCGRMSAWVQPTRTFIIDVPAETAYRRAGRTDRMERKGLQFQEKVRSGFLDLARKYPPKVAVIDGRGSTRDVHLRVVKHLPARGWSACSP